MKRAGISGGAGRGVMPVPAWRVSNKQIGKRTGLPLRGVMSQSPHASSPSRTETRFAFAVFAACLAFHFWGVGIGWESKNLPGVEFRQAQTAISALFIKQENNFSLAYPTPVLGKPWSIPMEFPLYQWTVVLVGKLTGLGITKAGRAVSIACFYLMLPALFLLLARWRVAPGRRWFVLALVVTCPLYIFYARAFLIETMVLMFSLWFWVAFERAVAERNRWWLAVAIVAGTGAGLVKVTTFLLYLIPTALWALQRLWATRRDGRWRGDLVWMAGGVAVPFAATLWWLHFADAVKEQNPLAHFLVSANLSAFSFGTNATRFSAEFWLMKGRIVAQQLTWLPAMLGCAVLALFAARARWREISLCIGAFGAALIIFPVLYAFHDYYYVANTVLLIIAMGLVLVALAESARPRWFVALVVLTVTGGQAWRYLDWYYPVQTRISNGGDGLTQPLRLMTRPDEVLVITGQDWNPMTPYYAQRRALMLRADELLHPSDRLRQALADLGKDKIGALLLADTTEHSFQLNDLLVAYGLDVHPLFCWHNVTVYLRAERRAESVRTLQENDFYEVTWAPGTEPPADRLAGAWYGVASLLPQQLTIFNTIRPRPVRFFSSFGPALGESHGQTTFGAHPTTRLVFALTAGRHMLRGKAMLPVDAYRADLSSDKATDGVEITLAALGPAEARKILYAHILDPRNSLEDRGEKELKIEFSLQQAGEVELFFGPGPQGRDTRDWISLVGPLVID